MFANLSKLIAGFLTGVMLSYILINSHTQVSGLQEALHCVLDQNTLSSA